MKSKIIYFMLVALWSTAFMAKGQNSLYPQQNVKHIPFGKKLPPPPAFSEFQKNIQQLHLPYQGPGVSTQQGGQPFLGAQSNGMYLSRHQNTDNSSIVNAANTTTFHLVKDINTLKESYPSWFAVLNNITYFAADDGVHGVELWRSDGTTAGTYLVKDINPGRYSANIREITAANGKIYFSAYTDAEGQQPWVSDGTKDGTRLLKNIPGSYYRYGSFPTEFVNVNGTVYFITDGQSFQCAIWKTDGTEAGTMMIKDLALTDGANYIYQSTAANGLLFFVPSNSTYGQVLGRSDGTDTGTYMIYPYFNYYSSPLQLTEFNNKLYFSADDGSGRKLWMSDGTPVGTNYAPNNNPVTIQGYSYDFFAPHFTIVGKALFFWAYTSVTGWELYKYEPSLVANIELVKNISPGTENTTYDYYAMINVNDTLYFKITNPAGGNEIWMSKGKVGNTQKVISFPPGGYLYSLFNGYGTLYFNKSDATYGYELWKTDGTEAGTTIVKDINPGSAGSNPSALTASNGKIIFSATQGNHGQELWITDGSKSGTTEVKDINTTTTDNSNPNNITAYTHGVMFTAYTSKNGSRFYKSDGTDAGTKLLNDSITNNDTTYFYNFSSKGDKVYFVGYNSAGTSLYETDGTNDGAKKLAGFGNNFIDGYRIADNGFIFCKFYNSSTGFYELWASDGSGGQGYLLTNALYYYNDNLITIGNTAFFVAGDYVNGYELWKSDGTVSGTVLVKDIYPGEYGSYPSGLYNYKGKLYFAADYGLGPFLWTSDGTDAGTKVVKAMYVSPPFAQANGKLFFNGYNIIGKGYELYATDGTGPGTKLVKDIFKGPGSSSLYSLVSGDTMLYFMANDGKHGSELWKSNGIKEGTGLVKNITHGINDSYFNPMVNVKDNLFFMSSFSDSSSPGYSLNNILWQSDGTKTGTKKVPLNGIMNINGLTASGDMLFFSGYTYATGQELYVGTVGAGFTPVASFAKNDIMAPSQKPNAGFGAKLLTNPVTDQLKFSVAVKDQQAAQIMISDASGRVLKTEKRNLATGTNMFSYNTQTWVPGMYMIKITASDGSSSLLKALK